MHDCNVLATTSLSVSEGWRGGEKGMEENLATWLPNKPISVRFIAESEHQFSCLRWTFPISFDSIYILLYRFASIALAAIDKFSQLPIRTRLPSTFTFHVCWVRECVWGIEMAEEVGRQKWVWNVQDIHSFVVRLPVINGQAAGRMSLIYCIYWQISFVTCYTSVCPYDRPCVRCPYVVGNSDFCSAPKCEWKRRERKAINSRGMLRILAIFHPVNNMQAFCGAGVLVRRHRRKTTNTLLWRHNVPKENPKRDSEKEKEAIAHSEDWGREETLSKTRKLIRKHTCVSLWKINN